MALLEREHELDVVRRRVARAAAGEGGGVAVSGASGSGKSALVDAACEGLEVRVLRGACDPLSTPRPLGPFRDVAVQVGRGDLARGGDRALMEWCDELVEVLRAEPTVLVVEDLHWVDAASVEVLRLLTRRLESLPLALLLTHRDDELGPQHVARPLLGEIARTEAVDSVDLHPLSVTAVRELVEGTGLDPARVHGLTGGNPFFVTEVVKDPDRPLPTTVRDAVLARTADVDPSDLTVLQLVATAPDRLDDRLLPALGVDLPTLERLDATGLLVRSRGGLAYRHELARQAVESTIPPGGSTDLHRRLVDAFEHAGVDEPAVLTHHTVAARDARRAAHYARLAAEEAAHAGAHTEAAAFYATALEHLRGAPPAERAELLQRLSIEQYMTSRLAEAIGNIRTAMPLWEEAGETARLALAHETCAVFEYYDARRPEAEAEARRAEAVAAEAPAEIRATALFAARSRRGFLAYMRSDVETAVSSCAVPASEAPPGQPDLVLRGELVRGLAEVLSGREGARERVLSLVDTARARGWDDLASTGYSQLVSIDVEHLRFRSAGHLLEESLPFTVARDIPICRHWQTAVRSRWHFVQGRWDAALEDAEQVLGEDGMPIATLWPHLVSALVPLRRGQEADVDGHLERAAQLADRLDEPLRRLPVLSALAERMWMTGVEDPRVTALDAETLTGMAAAAGTGWAVAELGAWLVRLGIHPQPPPGASGPWMTACAGRHDEAATLWHELGAPFDEAMTRGDAADPALRAQAVRDLDRLGAVVTADRHRAALRRDGVEDVPPRPRVSTRGNPGGLTNRQLDVARLVARGYTNGEIAERLYISPKTADHHVSAVLFRLGLANRRAVVVRAGELGLD